MRQPSKDWKEIIPANEQEIFTKYTDQFKELQKKKSETFGKGRMLHRKQILGLNAKLEVSKDLPEYAKFGLFKKPGSFDALIRLSNGGMDIQSDTIPDIRGFSIKILGLDGSGALGNKTKNQDFLLINHSTFSLPNFEAFIKIVLAMGNGMPNLLKHLIGTHGFFGGIMKIVDTVKTMGKPFSGFATENFHSAAPISCGPYAAKVRLTPVGAAPGSKGQKDWGIDFLSHLVRGPLSFDLQLQFYVDANITPIENPTVEWPESETPFVTVGRLTIPVQDADITNKSKLAEEIELSKFDPWNALIEHKPLGEIMRARKHYYFISQEARSK